ncbi:para-nitrobenzyl esterase [Herbihabitans rhizosphaerae]|uniref:Carboxylic ester hydrolase n=1 Tax=Herbihabitans rhizosphaerae TaxID=1872711 RepID=A0A4Q7KWM9_9PSEU|nr:carboxylesterase family protein [Herbihabitans rhizosphaerae]RZS41105.1 para-nitrobenzyl esterase [Herbihabitans rhizosphaerae]
MTDKRRRALSILVAAAALAVAFPSGSSADTGDESPVRTDGGWLRGTVTEDHRSFRGIPYAAAPVGDLRWRAPHPPRPWTGERDATVPGAPCPQLGEDGMIGSEDCLSLNVTTPRTASGPLPVLVFVHGGGLLKEHGALYDPQRIVAHDAVVVTLNYRLGVLGFLRHPALRDPYAGNFGLADQQAALRWVRRNIAAFGGDQRNVTLWGQSGGGVSVCAQLAAPAARGLFDKAIVQSASCGNDVLDPPTATSRGLAVAADTGCAEATDAERCLRDTPVDALVREADYEQTFSTLHRRAAGKQWLPVAGTAALPLQPLTALRHGLAADVPLIHGGTKHEMRSHVAAVYDLRGTPVSAAEYPKIVGDLFGRDADRVLATYPAGDHPTPSLALATLLTDYGAMVGACNQLPAIDAAARRSPVYAYEYAQPSAFQIGDFPLGAHHSADLPNFLDRGAPPSFTPEQKAFSERLIGHVTDFARTGAPGAEWPAYRRGTATVLSLAIGQTGPVDLAREHRCGFWRSIG